MKLVRLEVRNYRSIENCCGQRQIVFDGLDCLVGKNNAGKSNILRAVNYLLEGERLDESHFYNHDAERIIDVRGYFSVFPEDFELLEIENKRETVKKHLLEDGTLGLCRRSSESDLELIRYFPKDKHLRQNTFSNFHERAWSERDSKTDFCDRMKKEYPELEPFLRKGKETNKTEWTNAYDRFLDRRPEDYEFVPMPGSLPTGISADFKNLLPKVIFVPAVKDVSDVAKASSTRAELGALLAELSLEVRDEMDEAIEHALRDVYRRLNIIEDDSGTIVDDRHPGIQKIESHISSYLSETFENMAIRLEFPNPESKSLFDNANVWVNEEGFEDVTVDGVGEGVKRILIFSLIRALADLKQGRLKVGELEEGELDGDRPRQSLIMLYEEAELFLHPGLQRILLRAFDNLTQSGDQVIFTTHSPFMLRGQLLSTINLVSKVAKQGTTVLEFHSKLNEREGTERNRLLQVQNAASYIFSEKIVLVEGESDRIMIRKFALTLNEDWDFEQRGIPILPVLGKGDLPLYKDFLDSLNIQTFVVTDIDAIEHVLGKLSSNDAAWKLRNELLQQVDALIEKGEFTRRVNKKFVQKLANQYAWNDVFEQLGDLYLRLSNDEGPTDEQLACLEKLLLKKETNARKTALVSDHPKVKERRNRLAELLLEEGILCLRGTIEDYYPGTGDKMNRALQFDPSVISREDICSYFCPLPDKGRTDMETFLGSIFANV